MDDIECMRWQNNEECEGILTKVGVSQTLIGKPFMNGTVDPNSFTETFECSKCGCFVKRRFKWELITGSELDFIKTMKKEAGLE